MSVASELTRISNAVAAAYTAVSDKGGTVPASATVANLATAVNSITTPSGSISITANGTYNVTNYASASVAIPVYDGSVS